MESCILGVHPSCFLKDQKPNAISCLALYPKSIPDAGRGPRHYLFSKMAASRQIIEQRLETENFPKDFNCISVFTSQAKLYIKNLIGCLSFAKDETLDKRDN